MNVVPPPQHLGIDWVLLGALFLQFAIISLLAFGGGQAVLPLIEREKRRREPLVDLRRVHGIGRIRLSHSGPVTTMAAFVGYMRAGWQVESRQTLGMFLAPTILAGLAAAGVAKLARSRWVKAFGAAAAQQWSGSWGRRCGASPRRRWSPGPW